MGLLKLLGLYKDKEEDKEKEKSCEFLSKGTFTSDNKNEDDFLLRAEIYAPKINIPTTNKWGHLRGIDTITFRIKYDADIKSVILLIHQPRNHSFLHIIYDIQSDLRFVTEHDGHMGITMGSITTTTINEDNDDEIIIEWNLSASCPLDKHAVETFIVFNDEVVKCDTQKVYITENEDKKIVSKDQEINVKKMLEQSNGVKDDISKKILEGFEIDKEPPKDVMPIGKTVKFE